jgi:hypothetical protein
MSRCVNDTNAVRLLMGVTVERAADADSLPRRGRHHADLNARLALFVLLPYPLFILWRARSGGVHH